MRYYEQNVIQEADQDTDYDVNDDVGKYERDDEFDNDGFLFCCFLFR